LGGAKPPDAREWAPRAVGEAPRIGERAPSPLTSHTLIISRDACGAAPVRAFSVHSAAAKAARPPLLQEAAPLLF